MRSWALAALIAIAGAGCSRDPLGTAGDGGARDLVAASPDLGGPVCGGLGGRPCLPGAFCETGVGQCCCDFQGVCRARPTACDKNLHPVCGCDGVTYDNDCERQKAGASPSHDGACAAPFACGTATCAPSQVCFQGCSGIGPPPAPVCQPAPAACNGAPRCACIPAQQFQTCTDLPGGGVLLTQDGCA